jgi:hypothetical protein
METPENNEKSGKIAYKQPVKNSWPVVQNSPDGTMELAWYKSKFPDNESIIGWFDDSIEPVKAQEYLQMISDFSRDDVKETANDPINERYDAIYDRPAMIY